MVAPADVQLDMDDKTMVQPDIFVVCDRSKLKNGRLYGAPDFVVEVLSPSTRKKDMFTKLAKYANADVREYWIVDPDKKRVLVYDFESDDFVKVYTFEDKVPVGIFNRQCEVNFAEIYDYIHFLYEE
jgi:Uma2 family endonuclease